MPEQVNPVYSKLNEPAQLIVAALQLHGWGDEAISTMNAALLCDRAEQAFQRAGERPYPPPNLLENAS